ncbi:hypothetical protein LWI29_014941 [Acer saccharum]|uniref:RNase H type-1 domain-containing protein n=1 Tax=Acer saccharum TaxID=4024 RepID=A0AA39VG18_ACESA|nr:hypothetical protein LWI29_014941 [Acer saccharum]
MAPMEVRLYHVNLDRGSNASTIWFNLDWIMEALHAKSRNVDRGGTLPLLGNSSRGGAPPLSGNPEGECVYPPSGTQRMKNNCHNLFINLAEVDASTVAYALNSPSFDLCDASYVINDIRTLLKEVSVPKCLAIPRSGNSLAHNLASLAVSSSKEKSWLNVSPSCIFPLCE